MSKNETYNTIALCCLNEIKLILDKSNDYSSFKCNLNLRLNELINAIEKANKNDTSRIIPM